MNNELWNLEFDSLVPPKDLTKFPLAITSQPDWGFNVGPPIALACHKTLEMFPSSGSLEPMWGPVFSGIGTMCPMAVYVTHPQPWRPNVVSETWESIKEWSRGAVAMSVGNTPQGAGWNMDLVSGVQICFWEPELFSPRQPCSDITWYDRNPLKSVTDCLNMYRSRNKIPDVRPVSQRPPAPPDVQIGIPRPVLSWKTSEKFRATDCFLSITRTSKIAWFAQHFGLFVRGPWIWRFNECVAAIWLTIPPDPTNYYDMRPPSDGINFQHEMNILLQANKAESQGAGFMDLENGWQILFYHHTIDPNNICRRTKKVSMRACVDKMASLKNLGSQAGSSSQ